MNLYIIAELVLTITIVLTSLNSSGIGFYEATRRVIQAKLLTIYDKPAI